MTRGKFRETCRKRIIRDLLTVEFADGPVLLEELRWHTLVREATLSKKQHNEMTLSYLKSFARTIRDHLPDVVIHKIAKPQRMPIGIVARAAIFRIDHREALQGFLASPDRCIFLRFTNNRYWERSEREPRERPALICELYKAFAKRNAEHNRKPYTTKIVPTNSNISVVSGSAESVTNAQYSALARPECPLYRVTYYGRAHRISPLRSFYQRRRGGAGEDKEVT